MPRNSINSGCQRDPALIVKLQQTGFAEHVLGFGIVIVIAQRVRRSPGGFS